MLKNSYTAAAVRTSTQQWFWYIRACFNEVKHRPVSGYLALLINYSMATRPSETPEKKTERQRGNKGIDIEVKNITIDTPCGVSPCVLF